MAEDATQMKLSDLLEMMKGGASIKIDRPPQRISQLGELIDELRNMIAGQEARANVELERSKVQLEVLATLQAVINKKTGPIAAPAINLAPLQAVLAQLAAANNHEPVNYDFKILRSGPGLSPAVKIEARVVPSTRH